MFFARTMLRLLLACVALTSIVPASLSLTAAAQTTTAPAGGADPHLISTNLHPALAQVGQAIAQLNTRRWKAPNEVRDAADQDVASIQRDITGTLAGLLDQSDAAPGSLTAEIAVYRNVNALYDTLLRVALTANLAAPDNEAMALGSALNNLEAARSILGVTIQDAAQAQQAEFVRLRTAIAAAAAAQRQPVKTTIVDDGPAKETQKETTTHHHHITRKPPAKTTPNDGKPTPQ